MFQLFIDLSRKFTHCVLISIWLLVSLFLERVHKPGSALPYLGRQEMNRAIVFRVLIIQGILGAISLFRVLHRMSFWTFKEGRRWAVHTCGRLFNGLSRRDELL